MTIMPGVEATDTNWGQKIYGTPVQGTFASPPLSLSVERDEIWGHAKPAKIPTIEHEFEKHKKIWKRETQYVSNPSEKYLHPSYARIIGLGWPAAALIFRIMRTERDDWFYALRAITGANPVKPTMAGDMRAMTKVWLAWGARRGIA